MSQRGQRAEREYAKLVEAMAAFTDPAERGKCGAYLRSCFGPADQLVDPEDISTAAWIAATWPESAPLAQFSGSAG